MKELFTSGRGPFSLPEAATGSSRIFAVAAVDVESGDFGVFQTVHPTVRLQKGRVDLVPPAACQGGVRGHRGGQATAASLLACTP